jgi:pimeloyl-ACP methyl ester carboxylesterase
MEQEDVRFSVGDAECAGRLFRPEGMNEPTPCVVMGTGFSCVRDQGLDAFAERLADAGFAVLAFDYRHWGASGGQPRSLMDSARQREDWRAAISYVGGRDEVDSARIAMWGYSMGTGHVQSLAVDGADVAAIICVAPLLNTRSSLLHSGGWGHLAKLTVTGVRDMTRAWRRAAPYRIPAIGKPGSLAVINSPDALPGMMAISPPGSIWRNEVCARVALSAPYELGRKVRRIDCPALYCVFEDDDVNPPELSRRAAQNVPRGELRTYPGGHFALASEDIFDRVAVDQIEFLRRHLGRPLV